MVKILQLSLKNIGSLHVGLTTVDLLPFFNPVSSQNETFPILFENCILEDRDQGTLL